MSRYNQVRIARRYILENPKPKVLNVKERTFKKEKWIVKFINGEEKKYFKVADALRDLNISRTTFYNILNNKNKKQNKLKFLLFKI